MKTLLTIIFLLLTTPMFSQNDSIAIQQIKEQGIYYVKQDKVIRIEPITYDRGTAGILSASMLFYGTHSEHVFNTSPVFYIYIDERYVKALNLNRFRLAELKQKSKGRKIKVVRNGFYSAKTGANTSNMEYEKISDNLYKYSINETLDKGCYGLFYDYSGGTPLKLYDFDIE